MKAFHIYIYESLYIYTHIIFNTFSDSNVQPGLRFTLLTELSANKKRHAYFSLLPLPSNHFSLLLE